MTKGLQVISDFEPAGSQPEAIDNLVDGLNDGLFVYSAVRIFKANDVIFI